MSVNRHLDRIEGFKPGTGKLDLFGYLKDSQAGAGLEYEHRIAKDWSAFASGRLGYDWLEKEINKELLAGLRWRF